MANNIFGEEIALCSEAPLSGFYRNGCCESGPEDVGSHTVCAEMTEDFLMFSKAKGNDLVTPRPEYDFAGLRPGDRWCLCAARWLEAYQAGAAPKVILEATAEKALEVVDLELFIQHAGEYKE